MGVEFYLILSAVQPDISPAMFWRLMLGTVAMLAFGYCGESGSMNAGMGFAAGEAGQVAANGTNVNKHVKTAFSIMRFIVTVGWSIYPLGYVFGYLLGAVNDSVLNLVYNLADFVNKI